MTRSISHITGVATVGVPVENQERALDFYAGTLGMEKRRDAAFGAGMRWIEVAPRDSRTTIALLPPGGVAAGIDSGIRLTTDSAEAIHAELQGQGVDVDEILRFGSGVPPMFSLRDPDGNTLYIIEQE